MGDQWNNTGNIRMVLIIIQLLGEFNVISLRIL